MARSIRLREASSAVERTNRFAPRKKGLSALVFVSRVFAPAPGSAARNRVATSSAPRPSPSRREVPAKCTLALSNWRCRSGSCRTGDSNRRLRQAAQGDWPAASPAGLPKRPKARPSSVTTSANRTVSQSTLENLTLVLAPHTLARV